MSSSKRNVKVNCLAKQVTHVIVKSNNKENKIKPDTFMKSNF